MQTLKRHLIVAGVALLCEVATYAITVTLPANQGIGIFAPLLLPGTILQFFVGGGMSMVDGLVPAWRIDLAFALGVLMNTTLMYGCCLLLAKMAKFLRSESRSR